MKHVLNKTEHRTLQYHFLLAVICIMALVLSACAIGGKQRISVAENIHISKNAKGRYKANIQYSHQSKQIKTQQTVIAQGKYSKPNKDFKYTPPAERIGNDICRTARSQLGVPYRYGGTSPKTGFDCSGFIVWVYKQHGYTVPRTAKAQAGLGYKIPRHNLIPGDIVAFKINSGYHTGIYTGNGRFIHSPSSNKTIREDSISSSYWSKRFIGARRVSQSMASK